MFRTAFVATAAFAALVIGAPSAAAVPVYQTATSLAVSGTVGVGCTVTLTATVTSTPPPIDAGQVRFFLDDSVDLGQPTLKSGKASATWIPTASQAGSHNLVAFYTGFNNNDQEAWTSSGERVVVNVVNAINLGSACVGLG
jgi:hypothetical protein